MLNEAPGCGAMHLLTALNSLQADFFFVCFSLLLNENNRYAEHRSVAAGRCVGHVT